VAVDIVFPKIGFSMEQGTLIEWLAAEGDNVSEGQPLYVLESDKSAQEIESPASGILKITGVVGEDYNVGDQIGQIE
jgi:pyruvate/2-oxoglutarate dehydrogenase complex dihydrolipoamide acyltransferase (E2) component